MARTKKHRLPAGALFTVAVLLFIGTAVGVFMVTRSPARAPTVTNGTYNVNRTFSTSAVPARTVFPERRTTTFTGSVPQNNAVLQSTPQNVTIRFSSPLGPSSSVVLSDGQGAPINLGKATFSDDRMSMISDVASGATGPISVSYTACTPDNFQCPSGTFGFRIEP